MPFPRPISSMRGAAFPTSPSSTRGRSRASSARDGQPRLWLRRLPGRLPVEQVRAARPEAKLKARQDLNEPAIADLAGLDDAAFRAHFHGSPVKRIGRDRFIRNVLIAAGNSAEPGLVANCRERLGDASPLVRGAAVWALSRLMDRAAFDALAADGDRNSTRTCWPNGGRRGRRETDGRQDVHLRRRLFRPGPCAQDAGSRLACGGHDTLTGQGGHIARPGNGSLALRWPEA
jgi:hypothetical protein